MDGYPKKWTQSLIIKMASPGLYVGSSKDQTSTVFKKCREKSEIETQQYPLYC
jgi:hypothetical protein